jgi:hypothetical protein
MHAAQLTTATEHHVINSVLQLRNPQRMLQRAGHRLPVLPVLMRHDLERQQAGNIIGRTFDRANAPRLDANNIMPPEMFNASPGKFPGVALRARDGVAGSLALNPTVLAPQLARPELPCRPHQFNLKNPSTWNHVLAAITGSVRAPYKVRPELNIRLVFAKPFNHLYLLVTTGTWFLLSQVLHYSKVSLGASVDVSTPYRGASAM